MVNMGYVSSSTQGADVEKPAPMTIALTGGPCSGKSSILALIRDRLSKRGYQVITVPEYATHFFANSDGFQGYWVGTQREKQLQDIFLRYQVTQEKMFREFAALNDKPSVLLLDRAVMDQKVFASSLEIWESVLRENNTSEEEILKSYDAVVHLGTCAKGGNYEWGPGSNNPGRYHSPEEAATLDTTCERVYQNHKQFRKVPHCSSFEEKVEQTMKYLEDALGVDGLAGRRQRVNVKLEDIPTEVLARSQAYVITSTYLDTAMHLSVRRRQRIEVDRWCNSLAVENRPAQPWKPAHGEGDTTFEERRSIPDDCYLARRVLTETAYYTEVQLASRPGIDKYVLSFQTGAGLHYEVFYFQGSGDSGAIVVDFPVGAQLPTWIKRSEMLKGARILKKNSTEEAAAEFSVRKDSLPTTA